MENLKEQTVGAIVATDYRTAEIFRKYGIDFCCGGHRTIEHACYQANINYQSVWDDIQAIQQHAAKNNPSIDFPSWPIDLLADYIEKKHHRFVSNQIPALESYLAKLCNVHGGKHPELFEIQSLFHDSAQELNMHMKKEELMLFPYIRKLVAASLSHSEIDKAPFGTVLSPIRMMTQEHNVEGERFNKIRNLSNNYSVPADGCNTYRLVFNLLEGFEEDLHFHIHLENNILFPKAIEMEHWLNVLK